MFTRSGQLPRFHFQMQTLQTARFSCCVLCPLYSMRPHTHKRSSTHAGSQSRLGCSSAQHESSSPTLIGSVTIQPQQLAPVMALSGRARSRYFSPLPDRVRPPMSWRACSALTGRSLFGDPNLHFCRMLAVVESRFGTSSSKSYCF